MVTSNRPPKLAILPIFVDISITWAYNDSRLIISDNQPEEVFMKKGVLALAAWLALGATAFAGGTVEPGKEAAAEGGALLKEAPELHKLVQEGKLPPLEQRLPKEPMVVTPLKPGKYGGTLRLSLLGNDWGYAGRYQSNENLLRFTPDWSGVIPNLAKKYEVSTDNRTYTFYLREGLKWSDGQPFGPEDFRFWYEDIYMNNDLTKVRSGWMTTGKAPFKFEIVDPLTIRYTFAAPYGFFPQRVAHYSGSLYVPSHYMKQYHIKYNPKANEQAKAAGYADWIEYFRFQAGDTGSNVANEVKPVMYAWKWEVAPGKGTTTRAVSLRNPYYWKVDPQGRQYPYIDRLEYMVLSDKEVLTLAIMNGELDHVDQHVTTLSNKSVFFENKDKGKYRFVENTMVAPNAMAICLNLNHPDPVKNALYNDKNFRIGMSHAINRQEIIDIVFLGQTKPAQVSPRPESDLYRESMAKQYTEFSIEKANQYLDRAGVTKRDADGYRLMADGRRLTIIFEIDQARKTFIDGMELLIPQWKKAGIEAQIKTMDRSLWDQRVRGTNDYDATIHYFGAGVGSDMYLDPRYFVPFSPGNSLYARGWATWYSNPQGIDSKVKPVEPPADVKESFRLWDQLQMSGSEAEQKRLMKAILDIAEKGFWHIGVCWEPDQYAVVGTRVGNVPDSYPWSSSYHNPAPTNVYTWFIQ